VVVPFSPALLCGYSAFASRKSEIPRSHNLNVPLIGRTIIARVRVEKARGKVIAAYKGISGTEMSPVLEETSQSHQTLDVA